MVSYQDLSEALHRQPFQPIRVHLQDGRCLDVSHEQLAVVGKTYVHIGIPAPGEVEPIMETFETIALNEIVGLEVLQPSSRTA